MLRHLAMTAPADPFRKRKRSHSGREEAYSTWDLTTAASRVAEGLPTAAIEMVQLRLALSNHEMAELVHISPRTLTRRRKETRLQPDESERVFRIGRLVEIAARVLGSKEAAREWFREPNFALGEQEPLELARTAPGAEIVERVLVQTEHGIPV
jgi:putative toxin-antitoxin system antitoxin component (TIGR02293 family)